MWRKWLWSTWRSRIVVKEVRNLDPDGFGQWDWPELVDQILQTESRPKT